MSTKNPSLLTCIRIWLLCCQVAGEIRVETPYIVLGIIGIEESNVAIMGVGIGVQAR
jgi:hypothetical protein